MLQDFLQDLYTRQILGHVQIAILESHARALATILVLLTSAAHFYRSHQPFRAERAMALFRSKFSPQLVAKADAALNGCTELSSPRLVVRVKSAKTWFAEEGIGNCDFSFPCPPPRCQLPVASSSMWRVWVGIELPKFFLVFFA